jgi:hypothetical protein
MERRPVDPEGELGVLKASKSAGHSQVGRKGKFGQNLVEETLVLEGNPI